MDGSIEAIYQILGIQGLEMRNSDRCILTSIITFLFGITFIGIYYFIDTEVFSAAIFPSISFLMAGYYYGMSRGWNDIELRRDNPEWFKGEKLDDD